MDFNPSTFRNDEIELLRAGEVADARVSNVGRLVRRHHVVPYTHFSSSGRSLVERGGSPRVSLSQLALLLERLRSSAFFL